MCARYSLVPTLEQVERLIGGTGETLAPRFNIAPTTDCLVRSASGLSLFRWGLVPAWADDPRVGTKMINARAETVAEKPSFRAAFRHRRVLVPATSFFEWRHPDEPSRRADDAAREGQASLFEEPAVPTVKQPYAIRRNDHDLLYFAGLWEEWRGSDPPLRTFTILTTSPNREMATLHDRMPAQIAEADRAMWLDPDFARTDVLRSLLGPAPDDSLEMYPVTRRVGNPRYQDPDATERCDTAS